jgi:hypothetical protein
MGGWNSFGIVDFLLTLLLVNGSIRFWEYLTLRM